MDEAGKGKPLETSFPAFVSGWAVVIAWVAPVLRWNQVAFAFWSFVFGIVALVKFHAFKDPRPGRGRAWFGVVASSLLLYKWWERLSQIGVL
jgi:hypothetical protein